MPASATRLLQRYREKRDFARTPEPAGAARQSAQQLEFVIQRHHARRLHYDFRLEWNGVLKSWAVPKGPSLDPSEKRLAVQVEDHPFEYRKFSGDIPAGEYGAGHVVIWDRGRWLPNGDVERGLASGKLDFTLEGERLHGKWALVRLRDAAGGKQNWLLIKQRDEFAVAQGPEITEIHTEGLPEPSTRARRKRDAAPRARRATNVGPAATALPVTGTVRDSTTSKHAAPRKKAGRVVFIAPQLATAVAEFPAHGKWLTELKFDGYRVLAYVDGDRVRCFSRSGLDWTHRMPAVTAALAASGLRDTWLDGELVAVNDRGLPSFQRLQQALDPASGGEPPIFMVFDILQLRGADLRAKPLHERRRLLQQTLASVEPGGAVRLVDFVDGASPALRDDACANGFEGVILKDPDARYQSGRNRAWLKLKCRREQEFVIGGYTRTATGRQTLTALLLGYYDTGGRLVFAGRAGTGFSEQQLGGLRKRLDRLATDKSPFGDTPPLRHSERAQWVRPELVAQVRFAEWTESGILRQPLFLGLREDKAARDVTRELDVKAAASAKGKRGARPRVRSAPATTTAAMGKRGKVAARASAPQVRTESGRSPPGTAVRKQPLAARTILTHPQRVLYPVDGVTKQQLAAYYDAIAHVLWPHLKSRPLSLVRATSNQGRVFFQRHVEGGATPGLTSVDIPGSDEEPYFVCSSQGAIPLLAQMGAVELHTWGSRMPQPEIADRITFDLDPDPTLPWPRVRDAATLVRGMLQELGLQALLKTSGGMGLHLVVPLVKGPPLEVAAAFARRVAEHLARLMPEHFSAKRGAPNRQGRIYVDWQRNQFAATTVAAYSPRHRPGVPVSLPVDWDELGRTDIRGPHFNLRNVPARIAERGDAWAALRPIRQSLTRRVIDRLDAASM